MATALLNRIELLPLEHDLEYAHNHWIKYDGMFKGDPDFAEIAAVIRLERESDD